MPAAGGIINCHPERVFTGLQEDASIGCNIDIGRRADRDTFSGDFRSCQTRRPSRSLTPLTKTRSRDSVLEVVKSRERTGRGVPDLVTLIQPQLRIADDGVPPKLRLIISTNPFFQRYPDCRSKSGSSSVTSEAQGCCNCNVTALN